MNKLTVAELIAELQNMPQDAEVRLAHQPSWPFEYAIDQVVCAGEDVKLLTEEQLEAMSDDERQDAENLIDEGRAICWEEGEDLPQPVVYLGEGQQIGYLPGAAANELGWGR